MVRGQGRGYGKETTGEAMVRGRGGGGGGYG